MRFDSDTDFKKRAYSAVVDLQRGEPEITKAWSLICDVSRKGEETIHPIHCLLYYFRLFLIFYLEFHKIYEELGITLTERGESYYQSMMLDLVQDLEKKGK